MCTDTCAKCAYICICTYVYVYMCAIGVFYTHMCVHICISVYSCLCVCVVHVCVCEAEPVGHYQFHIVIHSPGRYHDNYLADSGTASKGNFGKMLI